MASLAPVEAGATKSALLARQCVKVDAHLPEQSLACRRDHESASPGNQRTPLQQPLFILGVLFILVVFFVPGGLTRIGQVGVRLDRILRKPAVQEEVS